MKLDTQKQVDAAEKILRLTWLIVFGAVVYSVLTVTPLVQRVTPEGWEATAPILPIVVDAAVVIVVRVDAIVARLDGRPGGWPTVLRWLTGGMTLALNVGDSMLKGDWVGVGVHAVAPILLIVTAEASLMWRRAITEAVARIERERADERERQTRERQACEERSRADQEARTAAERDERERQERRDEERETKAREEREREREHAARLAHEERAHAAQLVRESEERADQRAAAERVEAARQRKEEQDRADWLRREQEAKEAAQKAERDRKAAEARRTAAPVSAAVSTPRLAVSAAVSAPALEAAHDAPAAQKMTEAEALAAVADGVRDGVPQRQLVTLTGWSAGWVAKQAKALTGGTEQLAVTA
ncbi:hypothetical protein [Streptomyces zaomyceticus]|uniref:hypothetical protein n=1 Tax=Streptomyces zaomyceticus TaxID=68286 RepID=UPI002E0EE9B7|nr:hypothetical protein OG237_44075 [Streptomyces zaomyceticus]